MVQGCVHNTLAFKIIDAWARSGLPASLPTSSGLFAVRFEDIDGDNRQGFLMRTL
jgi:hypothetical protein